MGETKFTPGPWFWAQEMIDCDGEEMGSGIADQFGQPVIWRDGNSIDMHKPDCDLVETAPELYQACEYLFRAGLKHGGNLSIADLRVMEAALAKARGQKVASPSEVNRAIEKAGAKARGEA